MVKLTRLDGRELIVNANLIELVEANPDTVITLITNKKYLVRETPEEIVEKTIAYYSTAGNPRLVICTDHSMFVEEGLVS